MDGSAGSDYLVDSKKDVASATSWHRRKDTVESTASYTLDARSRTWRCGTAVSGTGCCGSMC
jgi:hypothetical protein